MLRFDVTGSARLEQIARTLDGLARGGLQDEVRRRVEGSLSGLLGRVRAKMPAAMPDRYAAVLARVAKVEARVSGEWPKVDAVLTAGRRKVEDVEGGALRHPVYGRTRRTRSGPRRNPWVSQRVRGGFWAAATRDYALNLRRALELAMNAIAERIDKS